MRYTTSTGTPREPETVYTPADGISTGGVLTLVVIAAIAVVVKRSGRTRGTSPGAADQAPPQAPEKLPTVSLEALRGDAPGPVPQAPAEPASARGMSPFSAPAAKLQAHKLDIPYELACHLQVDNWRTMCKARKLYGLERGDLEKTPYGVAVHVKFSGALDFAAVQGKTDQLEAGLDTESGSVRLRRGATAGRGIVDVRIRDPLADGVPWEPPSVPVRLASPVLLAKTPFGDVLELDLKQRIGVFGTSGSGKSCVQRLIGAHVAQAIDADLEIWDLKFGVESQHYEGKAHRVTTVDDAVDRLDWLLNTEYPRRAAKMRERGVSQWAETPWDPARVIVIDEGNVVVRGFRDWSPEKIEGGPTGPKETPLTDLFTLVEQGRALGVYWVWATQYPKASSLPTEIRSQLNSTVCMKMRTNEEAAVVFKDDVREGWAPHDLLGPGWLLLKDDAHTVPVDAKAVWLSVDAFTSVRAAVPDAGQTAPPVRTPGASLSTDCPAPVLGLSAVPDRTASTVSLDIWTVLLLSGDSPGLSELARRTARSKAAVHTALGKMTEDGTVVKDGAGYRIRTTEKDNG